MTISIVQRKRAAERGTLLEGDVALRCACGNVDSAPSIWFTSRVAPRIECSAECGGFMHVDRPWNRPYGSPPDGATVAMQAERNRLESTLLDVVGHQAYGTDEDIDDDDDDDLDDDEDEDEDEDEDDEPDNDELEARRRRRHL